MYYNFHCINTLSKQIIIKTLICSCLSILLSSPSPAQEKADSIIGNEYTFRPQRIILPASLLAVGAYGINNGAFKSVRHQIKDEMGTLRGSCYLHADDYLQYLPVISYVGLGCVAKHRHNLQERLLITATAYAAMGIMVNGIKFTVNEKRPNSSATNSFPSGHTATAFMGAELIRMEYGTEYAIAAYTVAGGIAFLRLYNDRHWLNDVIAGAGIGILSARIGYWLLPVSRHLPGIHPKNAPSVGILPAYNPSDRTVAVTFSLTLPK